MIDSVAANVSTYVDATVTSSSSDQYRVYAYNDSGNSDYSNVAADDAGEHGPGRGRHRGSHAGRGDRYWRDRLYGGRRANRRRQRHDCRPFL